jgi:hypothetical protein
VIKNREKIGLRFLVEFLVKTFRHDLFYICFGSVFELPSLRNTQKRTKKKSRDSFSDGGWVGLGVNKCTEGSALRIGFLFGGPLFLAAPLIAQVIYSAVGSQACAYDVLGV